MRVAADRATTLNERALRRISADLHDGPGQTLSLALMRLDALRERAAGGTPAAPAELGEVEGALQDAHARHAGDRGRPADARAGAAVGARRWPGVPSTDHTRRTGTAGGAAPGRAARRACRCRSKITFFRALQELLSNATRHGGGADVRVTVDAVGRRSCAWRSPTAGPGFDPARLEPRAPASGLPGMREQAELLGGGFEVHSAPGRGTAIRVWWPLAVAAHGDAPAR